MTLALSQTATVAVFLSVFGALMLLSVVLSRAMTRVGVPVVLLFLILGMVGGSEGIGGVPFDDFTFAYQAGTVALVLILFDGGLNTSVASIRSACAPAGVLATIGVAGTAGLMALAARGLGLSWPEALLIGAIVSSTDAAAVFAVLRGGAVRLKQRIQTTLEVEACANDPMAVILTVVVVEALRTQAPISGWGLALDVILQLGVGLLVGIAFGIAGRMILTRVRVTAAGLYSAITLAVAFTSYGAATLLNGSGFLAVFCAAVALAHGQLPYRAGLVRVHDALAWLCQIAMFLMLGLLVFPSKLTPVAWLGLGLGMVLALVARPLITIICLMPFRYPIRESAFAGWFGLRGAVPIILGTIPIMAGLPEGDRVFHIVFFIVVLSTLVPGASIVPLARKLGLLVPEAPAPSAAIEINSLRSLDAAIMAFRIDSTLAVCDASLAQVRLPDGAAVVLVVRGDDLIAPRGATRLLDGDFVYVLCKEADRPYIELLFGRAEGSEPAS